MDDDVSVELDDWTIDWAMTVVVKAAVARMVHAFMIAGSPALVAPRIEGRHSGGRNGKGSGTPSGGWASRLSRQSLEAVQPSV